MLIRKTSLKGATPLLVAKRAYWRKDGYQETALDSVLVYLKFFFVKLSQALRRNFSQTFGVFYFHPFACKFQDVIVFF